MASKHIKVNALARELGVPSHAIIARCRSAGMPVQNSVTKLTPDTERIIRTWYATGDADRARPPHAPPAPDAEPTAGRSDGDRHPAP
ncbi:MAG: translation initiation factor IF-2 N-terminal domain-containing protein [Phycisphaerae bacterium]